LQRSRLIIHCSDTPNGRHTSVREIDRWHAARHDIAQREEAAIDLSGLPYPYCGYHGIILLDGTIVRTRLDTEKGSHCKGYNADSLGFCLIGTDKYTLPQWESLKWQVNDAIRLWGALIISGHREFNSGKTCPGFDVQAWLADGMKAPLAHILNY
jgi:N-acetylmuramoyl-L-alanine amidase